MESASAMIREGVHPVGGEDIDRLGQGHSCRDLFRRVEYKMPRQPVGSRRMKAMLTSFFIVLCLTLTPAGQAKHQSSSPAPKVFVFTADPKETPPNEEEQGRLDSVKDMREALSHKAGLEIVSQLEDATVLIEVLQREKKDAGVGGFGGTSVTPQGEVMIRLHLKFGDQETDIKGVAAGYWGRAAKDAADKAFKWIVRIDNLPANRKSSNPS
jgi:hypothetical protein